MKLKPLSDRLVVEAVETTMNGLKRTKLLNGPIYLSLVLYLIALVAPATATAQSNPTPVAAQALAAIDADLETQRQELRIPGPALGIIHGDQIVHLKGFGLADPGGQTVTAQTPFILNSISKSFAPLAIMQQVASDRIELDAPVERYLPWFRVAAANASTQSRAVTSHGTENGISQLMASPLEKVSMNFYVTGYDAYALPLPATRGQH